MSVPLFPTGRNQADASALYLIAAANSQTTADTRRGTVSQAELTPDRVITRFITRSPRCPPLPFPGPDAAIAAELPMLDDVEPAPLRPCLRGLIGRIDLLGLLGGKR